MAQGTDNPSARLLPGSTFSVTDAVRDLSRLELLDKLFRPETQEEMTSRVWRANTLHIFQLVKEGAIILGTIIGVVIFSYICIEIIRNPAASADDKKWATSIITLVVGGLIGYFTGRSSQAKPD